MFPSSLIISMAVISGLSMGIMRQPSLDIFLLMNSTDRVLFALVLLCMVG